MLDAFRRMVNDSIWDPTPKVIPGVDALKLTHQTKS